MRLSTILTTLMLTTALTACGGGGGGGHGHIPHTTLPNVGTSIKAVNNTQERTTAYEDAAALVGLTSDTSAEDINKAYENMEKILVQEDVSTATKEDILLSLALVGEDIEELKDMSLDELKSEIQNLDIKEKAEDVYAKLGTERNLSLNDVEFYGPFEDDGYAFIVDENQNVKGLKINHDDSPTGVIEYTNAGNGVYKNTKGYTSYGFVCAISDADGDFYSSHSIIVDKDATKEDIVEAFKNKVKNGGYDTQTEEKVLAWLDSADLGEFLDEDTCEEQGNCFYKESLPQSVKMDSLGKSVGLKYSDFGKVDYNLGNEKGYMAYYGGYKGLEATAQDLPQVDTEMNFEGKSVAIVYVENIGKPDKEKIFNGSMNLNFKDGKETLTADFTDWHKITIASDTANVGEYTFAFEGTPKDADFAFTDEINGTADIKYYGENLKKPDEVVGSACFGETREELDGTSTYIDAEMAFGGVRK
ncbi:MAG: hypothetical protein E7016_01150 [Alphaproteobacteria bacterium]|nr:hypothetical protein [Alphaproteobacteria bacterium]